MKKIVLRIAVLCCVLLLFTCTAVAVERVVIYTAAEDERIAFIQDELNKQFRT